MVEVGYSLAVDLVRQDLECEASVRYKGYMVRSRLKKVPNKAVKCNTSTHEEKVRRFPFRYIKSVKSKDGCMLGSNREMREAIREHFRGHFAHCPDLPVPEFCSYLANLPCLQEAEVASCEGLVTECGP